MTTTTSDNNTTDSKLKELVSKFKEYDDKAKYYEERVKKYRQKIRQIMERGGEDVVRLPDYTIRLSNSKRSAMIKKQTPKDIWDRYAVVSQHQTLWIRPNKKK